MKIFIPADKKQDFIQLSAEYKVLHEELGQEPTPERRAEIINRIACISKQFETGLMSVTGFEAS